MNFGFSTLGWIKLTLEVQVIIYYSELKTTLIMILGSLMLKKSHMLSTVLLNM